VLDFKWYKEKCGIDTVDYIYVLLGANEIADSPLPVDLSDRSSVSALCERIIESAKEFVNIMREAFPNVKIKIMGLIPPSQNGGMGSSYGAKLPYCDKYGYTRYTFELNLRYEALCYEEGYSDFLEFVNIGAQFDSEYAYPKIDKPVNTRCKEIERIGTNGLHPTNEGYLMIADAVFRNMADLC
jgi:lysophospholipase L1-like esterase